MTPTELSGAENLVRQRTPESGDVVAIWLVEDLLNSQDPAAAFTADQPIPRIRPPCGKVIVAVAVPPAMEVTRTRFTFTPWFLGARMPVVEFFFMPPVNDADFWKVLLAAFAGAIVAILGAIGRLQESRRKRRNRRSRNGKGHQKR